MNDSELQAFEAELRKLRPAIPPESLSRRLAEARLGTVTKNSQQIKGNSDEAFVAAIPTWLRWFVPAAAVLILGVIVWTTQHFSPRPGAQIAKDTPRLRADDVSVERELVSSFDAIAELPGGEPVRFQFQEWMDDVKVRDSARGLLIQKRSPRVEIVPVRFETY